MYYSIPVAVVYTLKDLLYAWAGVFLRIKLSGHNIIKQLSTSYPMEREREREKSRVKKVGAYQLSVKISYKWVIPRAKTIF